MSFIRSNTLMCSYCHGDRHSQLLRTLNDEEHNFMLNHKDYRRDEYFCAVCIERINNKLNKLRRRNESKRNRSPHGTTVSTKDPIDPSVTNQSPNETTGTRSSNEQSNAGQAGNSNRTGPNTRRFAVKSTGGRPGTRQPPTVQPPTSIRNTSTRSQTNTTKPGPSGVQKKKTSAQKIPADSSSSEVLPHYGHSGTPLTDSERSNDILPSPLASPNGSSANVSVNSDVPSPNTPQRSPLQAPTAPMPKNRPIRNQAAGNTSPQRPGESASAFRERLQRAHRQYFRGGSG